MSALHAAPVTVVTPAGPRDLPPLLRVATELPGLPGHHEWTLAPLDETGLLFTLRSEPDGVRPARLFVVEPHAFFPDYAPTVPSEARAALGLAPDEAPVLLVGTARQIAAMAVAGDRRARLANITVPTLVIHGTDDPLIPPACGQDTALSIPNAVYLPIDGMGHDLPREVEERIIDAIRNVMGGQS